MFAYLDNLNEPQLDAVKHLNGPLIIIAGAGSGKTKVLTSRIAHLIHNKVDAFRIMALTFTNKAAQEIKNRVEISIGNTESRNIYAGTFHSIFARILRVEAHQLGYTNNFSIYDVEDSKSVLKQVIKDLGLDPKAYKLPTVYNRISNAKNELINVSLYEEDSIRREYDNSIKLPRIWEIYKHYSVRCFRNNAMDFDDILLNTHNLFEQFPLTLHKYQHKILHILIDEFQDTNPLQYAIVKKLAAVHENICVVGDDAQSIYSFRGATIENILQFQKEYPTAKFVKLEQNYRSSKNILNTANSLIKHNQNQFEKKLWTPKEEGQKVTVSRYSSDNEEARGIVNKLMEIKLRNQISANKIAILYRTNAQSRVFEETMRRNGIPYIIYGGFSFYQRKEIKDLIAYLRVILNPQDNESLIRIINYPLRGIGQTSLNKYTKFAFENQTSLYEILKNITHFETKPAQTHAVKQFVEMIEYLKLQATTKDAYELAIMVGKQTGIYKELLEDKTPEGLTRLQNIDELFNSIKQFISEPLTPEEQEAKLSKDLSSYLQQVSLMTGSDEDKKNEEISVKLMTIHAAKGLEFECVFVCGMQEGVFPSMYSTNNRDELEEERRLFYVAITRAEHYLYISYSNTYYFKGRVEACQESRFLEELDEQYILSSTKKLEHYPVNQMSSSFKNVIKQAAIKPQFNHKPSQNFNPTKDFTTYRVGLRLEHEKFGFGEIKTLAGEINNLIATINFDMVGEKKIMLKYAKTQLLNP